MPAAPRKRTAKARPKVEPTENALVALESEPKVAEDFYKRLRTRIRRWLSGKEGKGARWAEILMFAPDLFHLIVRLAMAPEVALANRMRLAAAAAYFMSPIDFVPEMLTGPLGFLDDIALAAYVLHRLVNTTDLTIVQRHWAGEVDLLKLIQRVLDNANAMLGVLVAGRIQRLAKWVPKAGGKPGAKAEAR